MRAFPRWALGVAIGAAVLGTAIEGVRIASVTHDALDQLAPATSTVSAPGVDPRPVMRPQALLVLAVDNDPDPLDPAKLQAPTGVEITSQDEANGPGLIVRRHHASVHPSKGENLVDASRLLADFLGAIPAPRGDRFALEELLAWDDRAWDFSVVGASSRLVKTEPVLVGAEVATIGTISAGEGPERRAWLMIELKPDGAAKLATFSAANVGHVLAVEVDGTIVAAPRLVRPLTDGRLSAPLNRFAFEAQLAAGQRIVDQLTRGGP